MHRFENPDQLPVFLYLVSYPRGHNFGVQIFVHTHLVSQAAAQALLDEFGSLVKRLAVMLRTEPLVKLSVCTYM